MRDVAEPDDDGTPEARAEAGFPIAVETDEGPAKAVAFGQVKGGLGIHELRPRHGPPRLGAHGVGLRPPGPDAAHHRGGAP